MIDILQNCIKDALNRIDSVIDENNIRQSIIDNKQYIINQKNKIDDWQDKLFALCNDKPIDIETSLRTSLLEVKLYEIFPQEYNLNHGKLLRRK